MESLISEEELRRLRHDLKHAAAVHRRDSRRLDTSLSLVSGVGIAILITLLASMNDRKPVTFFAESFVVELQKELDAHQARCDTLLLGLNGDG